MLIKCPKYHSKSSLLLRKKWGLYNPVRPHKSHIASGLLIPETLNGRERIYRISSNGKLEWYWSHEDVLIDSRSKSSTKRLEKLKSTRPSFSRIQKILSSTNSHFRRMFLPIGYPHSVHRIYKSVHIWQFAETTVGSIVSVFCSQAMLSSVGVNPDPVSTGAAAVAINWVLKDTLGEALKLSFIQRFSHSFDSHPKGWKAFGEVCSLLGATLMLSTALVPSEYFLLFAGLGVGLRGIHYSIWGATHMTFTRNFALNGNVGDLVAKDDTQMSLAHLIGTAVGVSLLNISHSTEALFAGFAILGPIHLYTTISLLHSTRFAILNQTSLTLLSEAFVRHDKILNLTEAEQKTIGFGEWIHRKWKGPKVVIGSSIKEAFGIHSKTTCILSLQSALTLFEVRLLA
jgi:hypothetical protein